MAQYMKKKTAGVTMKKIQCLTISLIPGWPGLSPEPERGLSCCRFNMAGMNSSDRHS